MRFPARFCVAVLASLTIIAVGAESSASAPQTTATSTAPATQPAAAFKFERLEYRSSVDGRPKLLADVCFIPDGKPKPLLLVMHGWAGHRGEMKADLHEMAPRGIFAIAPDMRGRGQSAHGGKDFDSGGLDVHDIIDAALTALAKYPGEIDAGNWNIVGYSGGGANAYFAGCRFPDLFNTAVSFFGVCDYGAWYNSKPDFSAGPRVTAILGPVEQRETLYEARNMIPAAANARGTRWWLFWDEAERLCPPQICNVPWVEAYQAAGGKNLQVHISKTTDEKRWLHGYRTKHDSLRAADEIFLSSIFQPPAADLLLPPQGELVVPGYVVTRHFSVFIQAPEGGVRGRVRIRYDLTGQSPVVQVIDNPRNFPVKIEYNSVTASLPKPVLR